MDERLLLLAAPPSQLPLPRAATFEGGVLPAVDHADATARQTCPPMRLPELSGQDLRRPGSPIDDFCAQHELHLLAPPVRRRGAQRSLEIGRFRDELACRQRAIRL